MSTYIQHILQKKTIKWSIILVTVAMMLPFPFGCAAIGLFLLYAFVKVPFVPLFKQSKVHMWTSLLLLISTVTSVYYANYIGALISVALALFYIYCIYYNAIINRDTFELAIDVMLGFSIVHALYAFFESQSIVTGIRYHDWHTSLKTWTDGRADSFFFNPNYYALICAFFLLLSLYKIAQNPQKKWGYILVGMANCAGMIFTQTRMILPAVVISVLTFGLLLKIKRMRRILVVSMLVVAVLAVVFHEYLPRFDTALIDHNLYTRMNIWQTTLKQIQKTFLFGQGPLTYMHINHFYPESYTTQHAHNLYLDVVLNFGIVGTLLCVPLLKTLYTRLLFVKQHPQMQTFIALMSSFIVVVAVHGLLDMTILWPQTLFVFVTVCLASKNLIKEQSM